MPFIKLGENIEIQAVENTESCIPEVSPEILENFKSQASALKKIAPRAEDFLYFSAVMMHAAEASAINYDGTPKLTPSGEVVKVSWDKSNGTWRWKTNDPNVKPYKNCNGDIFPEEELIKAYKKWKEKPLCIDHKSSSVDHTRGFIVDTYYDRNLKRVVALCALDKKNFPDLARKVATRMQTSVSMGTAVGKAICSDCATVARVESDFCDHMRRKTCYGEINIDLNPIELSIVVNGADPKAHIKHIIAAANAMNTYLEGRANQLNKLAHTNFVAKLSVFDSNNEKSNSKELEVVNTDLNAFKNDVDNALKELASFNEQISNEDTNHSALNQSESSSSMDEVEENNSELSTAPPQERFADAKDSIKEFYSVAKSIEEKLNLMKESLDKLQNINQKQEENMSGSKEINKKGYYQGTEEPTPGQVKYPKDPTNEKLRTDGDKHMEGQMDTGPVDGMHPGPDSVGMSELERKKMLARAAAEERALKRAAVVDLAKQAINNKKAYFNNGEKDNNPNTPTPHKAKYPVDSMNVDLRDQDKHMVGQGPFPGVGKVDGLHPSPDSSDVSDELKRKELLRRASLRARFVTASNDDGSKNLGKSGWEVFLGDKLLLTASVEELSGGRSEILFDSIATKDFGSRLIEKIKVHGAEKVKSLVKSAQGNAPAAPAAPVDAAPAPEAAPLPDLGSAPEEGDSTGKEGDPKETAMELAQKVATLASDLLEAVKALVGEKSEMGGEEDLAVAASFGNNSLNKIRAELNSSLTSAMKEAVAELNERREELEGIVDTFNSGTINSSNKELANSILQDASNEAKSAIADGFKLMTAFVKYARGTKAMIKRAELEESMRSDSMDSSNEDSLMNLLDKDVDAGHVDGVEGLHDEDSEHHDSLDSVLADDFDDADDDLVDDNDTKLQMDVPVDGKMPPAPPGTKIEVLHADDSGFDSKASRAELRAKLAAETLKFSPMLDEAHPKGGFTTDLDVKPSGDLAKVEDLEEKHKAMMDVAKAPPKVRKEAKIIADLIAAGTLDPKDLDALVAQGADAEAVAYYRNYYKQVDGGSEFASELVKEHVKAQMEEELNKYRVKLSRAYELTYDMVSRGLCHNDRGSISNQVDEIMEFDDKSFERFKKVVASHPVLSLTKEAFRAPQVGVVDSGEVKTASVDDDWSQLSAAFAKTSKRLF
jgi:hypothetical protein